MGIINKIFGKKQVETKSLNNSLENFIRFGDVASHSEMISPQVMYYKAAIAFTCVEMIVKEAETYYFYLKNENNEIVEDVDSKIQTLLFKRSLAYGGQSPFSNILRNILIFGEGYLLRTPFDVDSEPLEFLSILPNRVSKEINDNDFINGYYVEHRGRSIYITVDMLSSYSDLMRFSLYSSANYTEGVSPMKSVGIEGSLIHEGMRWNNNSIQKGCMPSGLISSDNVMNLTEQQISQIKQMEKEVLSGSKNARSNIILGGGFKFTPIQTSPADMDFAQSIKIASENVCRAFGVPLPLLFNEASTNDNITQMSENFTKKTVIPFVQNFLDTYSLWYNNIDNKNYKICIDYKRIPSLESEKERKNNRIANLVSNGLYTINEARQELDLPTIDDNDMADEIIVNKNLIALSLLGEEADNGIIENNQS